jgi:hypothetical protein
VEAVESIAVEALPRSRAAVVGNGVELEKRQHDFVDLLLVVHPVPSVAESLEGC